MQAINEVRYRFLQCICTRAHISVACRHLRQFLRITEQIVMSGPNLGMPYTKAMGQGLFEIRARGAEGIGRAFFCCMKDRKVVVLHSFIKKTQTTPQKELQIANKRMKEVYRD